MESSDPLLSIAEIALGLAGFGGIFVAFGRGSGRERRPADSYRLVMLLATALTTLFLALVPLVLQALLVSDTTVWPVASACLAVGTLVLMVNVARFTRRNREVLRAEEAPGVAPVLWVLTILVLVAQIANAAGFGAERRFGLFLAGLVFLLSFGAYLFARMLFLWEELKEVPRRLTGDRSRVEALPVQGRTPPREIDEWDPRGRHTFSSARSASAASTRSRSS